MTGDPRTARAVRDHKALAALDQYCKNEKVARSLPSARLTKTPSLTPSKAAPRSWTASTDRRSSRSSSKTCGRDFSPIRFMAAIAICAPREPLVSSAPHAPDEQERRASDQLAPVRPHPPAKASQLADCRHIVEIAAEEHLITPVRSAPW